jgi:YbbR domain-containing protein
VSWKLITDDWRLKLLALGLAVLMLGAVAFSQNPPTSRTLNANITYTNVPSNLILINPPSTTKVTITGLADILPSVTSNNMSANVDASHASAGSAVRLNVTASSTVRGVTVQNPPPIVVNIDNRQGKDLGVTVGYRAAPGWSVSPGDAVAICQRSDPCLVHFDGPASWENNLLASVTLPGVVNYTGPATSPNLTIELQNSNGVLDLNSPNAYTVPLTTIDPRSVSVRIKATAGSTSTTIALVDSAPTRPPPACARLTGVTIAPSIATISGDPVTLGRIQRIFLPGVDLSSHTTDWTVQIAVPYPQGVTGDVANASVKYLISQNPNAAPCT